MYHLQNGKEHIYALHVCYVGYLRMLNSILKEERNILQGLNIISFFLYLEIKNITETISI